MEKVQKRQSEIKNILSTVKSINVDTLSERLGVTGATIRKDLRDMESRREISRSRGQVSMVRPHIVDLNVEDKIFINAENKNLIGAAATALICDNDSIILTSGTTIEAMARHIVADGRLNVVTPSVAVALTLIQKKNIEVFVLGGHLHHSSLSTRDTYTAEGMKNISSTKLFLSCDGIDFGSGVVTATNEEARLTSLLMKSASKVILLCDSSKFGKTGFGKICNIEDVDIIITDSDIPEQTKRRLENSGIQLIIA